MCDTMGKLLGAGALFAKNSDRSPNEPQVLEYRPPRDCSGASLRVTYREIPQVPHTFATLLSRPVWMWGAEMGVNEHGVCIGNEAVFTKGKYTKEGGLTGMDMLRLALERAESAERAVEILLALLEQYGQGGNCGYDHSFYYDNAFLVMDKNRLYVLETAGKQWACRSAETASISNRLSIGADAQQYSGEACDFTAQHLEPLYSRFSGSKQRLAQTDCCIRSAQGLPDLFAGLRTHNHSAAPLTAASVASPCMHAGGLVGDHTTASMAVEWQADGSFTVWASGSSTPCVSLFKPWRFGAKPCVPVFDAGDGAAEQYWRGQEDFRRAAIGRTLPPEFFAARDALEREWLEAAQSADNAALDALSQAAAAQEEAFCQKWQTALPETISGTRRYLKYWQKKTEALKTPAREAVCGD